METPEHTQAPGEDKPEGKRDIKALVALIPPADALRKKEVKLVERRMRVRYDEDIDPAKARINPSTAKALGITDALEVVIAGRHKFVFEAVLDEEVPPNEVYCNGELLREKGVADNSIATVRKARSRPPAQGESQEQE